MTNDLFRWLLYAEMLIGIVAGGAYLVLYRAWELRRWRNPVVRDSSGWVVLLWFYFVWSSLRLLVAQASGAPPNPAPPVWRVTILLIGVGLDAAFIGRLRNYLRDLAEERAHPTRVCRRCSGRGIVPVGTPADHFDLPPWDDDLPPGMPPPKGGTATGSPGGYDG